MNPSIEANKLAQFRERVFQLDVRGLGVNHLANEAISGMRLHVRALNLP